MEFIMIIVNLTGAILWGALAYKLWKEMHR